MPSSNEFLKKNYRMVLFRDEENDLIAEAPELPGCVADGSTPDEAVQNLREAMKSWISSRLEAGLQVPEPSGTEAFSGRILVRLPKYLHKRLADQAREQGSSLNQYLVSILSEGSTRATAAAANLPVHLDPGFAALASGPGARNVPMYIGYIPASLYYCNQYNTVSLQSCTVNGISPDTEQRTRTDNRKVLPIRNEPAA